MKKQQLSVFLFLMMSLFFVGNVMGQNSDPEPKQKEKGNGNPNDNGDGSALCRSTWYIIAIEQSFNVNNPMVPDRIEVRLRTTWPSGHVNDELLISKTGNTLNDYYDEIDSVDGFASFELDKIYHCEIQVDDPYETRSIKREVITIVNYGNIQRTHIYVVVGEDNTNENNLILGINPYPNPSNQSLVQLSYKLSAFATVDIKVFDEMGNEILSIPQVLKPSGSHTTSFTLTNGIYICKVIAHNFQTNEIDIESQVIIRN